MIDEKMGQPASARFIDSAWLDSLSVNAALIKQSVCIGHITIDVLKLHINSSKQTQQDTHITQRNKE